MPDIGPRIGVDGEKEFRRDLANVTQSLKTLDSEMKVVKSSFEGQVKSAEQLAKENDVLERSALTLRDKLKMQQEALEKSVRKYGEADTKTMKWRQAVNETTAALNKAENQIKENNAAINNFGNEVDETKAKTSAFGDVFKGVFAGNLVTKGLDLLADGIKKLGSEVKDAALSSAVYADDINTLAKITGLSTKELQEFQYASELIDVDMDTLSGSLSKLTKNMSTAKKGTGDAATAFDALGISVTDGVTGELRNNKEVFYETIDALGKMTNETQRDAYSMAIFGRSAQDLNPLIVAGSDALAQYAKEANDFGLVLDDVQLNALNGFNDNVYRMKQEFEGMKLQFVIDNMGTFESVLGNIKDIMPYVNEGLEITAGILDGISTAVEAINSSPILKSLANPGTLLTGGTSLGGTARSVAGAIVEDVGNSKIVANRRNNNSVTKSGVVNIYTSSLTHAETDYIIQKANRDLGGGI